MVGYHRETHHFREEKSTKELTAPQHTRFILPLTSPDKIIAALRFANAVPPQTLLRTDEEELCQFDIIPPTTERNRAFPTGNALLYISLLSVDFQGASIQGAPCFCFEKKLEK